jgi:hypothetical protein
LDLHLKSQLTKAIHSAINGDWHIAHEIVQDLNDPYASWIHAVLHKIERDEFNSRYWYAKTTAKYEDFVLPDQEWLCLLDLMNKS